MKIRHGTTDDALPLHSLLNAIPELQMDRGVETYPVHWVRSVLKHPKTNLVLIAQDKGRIVGFLIAHLFGDIGQGIINDLYVAPACRRKGLGVKLLRLFEQHCSKRKFNFYNAFVLHKNRKMLGLLQKHGYTAGLSFRVVYKDLGG